MLDLSTVPLAAGANIYDIVELTITNVGLRSSIIEQIIFKLGTEEYPAYRALQTLTNPDDIAKEQNKFASFTNHELFPNSVLSVQVFLEDLENKTIEDLTASTLYVGVRTKRGYKKWIRLDTTFMNKLRQGERLQN